MRSSLPHVKTVVVTGGTGDLGSVVIARLLQEYRCAVWYRDEAAFNKLAASANSAEGLIGLSSLKEIKKVAPIYGLVHLAGGYAAGAKLADFNDMLEKNLLSAVRAVDAVRPHLAKGGRIVMISSATTLSKPAGLSAYTASKSALNVFVETLAKDFESRDITANALMPTTLDTPANRKHLTPDKLVKRENVAEMITLLLSDRASNVNGQLIAMTA
jgi:NAD(P)-dependent dehydrogenase (short-subunit alcohol dehydrogenase family)